MSSRPSRVVAAFVLISSPALANTVLWLTADEGTPGQPATSPVDSGDYALTVAGEDGVLYSADAAGVGAAASPYERSFLFDGADDLIRVTHDAVLNLSGDYTIEFFVKLTGQYTSDAIWQLFDRREGTQVYTSSAYPVPYRDVYTQLIGSYDAGGNDFTSSTVPEQGEWIHWALVYDPDDVDRETSVYVNGVFRGGRNYITGAGTNFTMMADLLLGAHTTDTSRNLEGLLDEIRISDEALEPSELLYIVPEPGTVSLLVVGGGLLSRVARTTRRKKSDRAS